MALVAGADRPANRGLHALAATRALRWKRTDPPAAGAELSPPRLAAVARGPGQTADAWIVFIHLLARRDLLPCLCGRLLDGHGPASMPELGSLGSWCGAITGAMFGVLLASPLLVLVLGLALLQGHGAAGLLVGLACAQWLKQQRRTDGGLPLPPETPGSPEYPPPRS